MDRLNELRGSGGPAAAAAAAGGSRDSSAASDAFLTADDSSKYFSLSEDNSAVDESPAKDGKSSASAVSAAERDRLINSLSPVGQKDEFKIGKHIEAATILSGGVDIFDDNENSYDGDELVIDENLDEKSNPETKCKNQAEDNATDSTCGDGEAAIPSKDTEVVLQIDGKNVGAIAIGNGLYLYRREGEQELSAVQIVDTDQQQPSFKFLKVRENIEGNLEVYEEIEVEVPKDAPSKKPAGTTRQAPMKEMSKVISEASSTHKPVERTKNLPIKETVLASSSTDAKKPDADLKLQSDGISEINYNGKTMKFNEAMKAPLIGSFTPMTFHSTPNKEGVPLTKVMVDKQLHPSRHSDSAKKTIEVNTESCKQKIMETKDRTDLTVENSDAGNTVKVTDPYDKDKESTCISEPVQAGKKLFSGIEPCATDNIEPGKNKPQLTSQDKPNIEKTLEKEDTSKVEPSQLYKDITLKAAPAEVKTNITTKVEPENVESKQTLKTEVINQGQNSFPKVESCETKKEKTSDFKTTKDISTTCRNKADTSIKEKIRNVSTVEKTSVTVACSSEADSSNKDKAKSLPADEKIPVQKFNATDVTSSTTEVTSTTPAKTLGMTDECASDKKVPSFSVNKKQEAMKDAVNDTPTQVNKNEQSSNIDKKPIKGIPEQVQQSSFIKSDQKSVHNISPRKCGMESKEISVSNTKVEDKSVKESHPQTSKVDTPKDELINLNDLGIEAIKNNSIEDVAPTDVPDGIKSVLVAKPITSESSIPSVHAVPHRSNQLDIKLVKPEVKSNPQEPKLIAAKSEDKRGLIIRSSLSKFIDNKTNDLINKHVQKAIVIRPAPKNVPEIINKYQPTPVTTSAKLHFTNVPADSPAAIPKKPDIMPASIERKAIPNVNLPAAKPPAVKPPGAKPTAAQPPALQPPAAADARPKSLNNNAVPFGKWTEANKQEYLSKIKETKVTSNNTNQIKQTNDLNRRDVLKKYDSQRQSNSIAAAAAAAARGHEQRPASEPTGAQPPGPAAGPARPPPPAATAAPADSRPSPAPVTPAAAAADCEEEQEQQGDDKTRLMTQMIDRTIVGMLLGNIPPLKSHLDSFNIPIPVKEMSNEKVTATYLKDYSAKAHKNQTSPMDDIEMQMNELHGIPFVERPPHQLPRQSPHPPGMGPHAPGTGAHAPGKAARAWPRDDSDDEIIAHEPVTGDLHPDQRRPRPAPERPAAQAGVITERDFDKFASQRNSIAYENRITVNYDLNKRHNVVQIVEKEIPGGKQGATAPQPRPPPSAGAASAQQAGAPGQPGDAYDKQQQSKVQMAYQSALTAKRQRDSPVHLEDEGKGVMAESPAAAKRKASAGAPGDDARPRHQRKQVLAPLDAPELELIAPAPDASPKKKRRTEEPPLLPKKTYLLGRGAEPPPDMTAGIDSLVMAAELLDNQARADPPDEPRPEEAGAPPTPAKRGRGRPRKNPPPAEGSPHAEQPSPQKRKRVERPPPARDHTSSEEDSSDSGTAIENWSMGKIDENIVCPICNKLFRSENVVYKHVKHCGGPSPTRSGSGRRSPRPGDSGGSAEPADVILIEDTPVKARPDEPRKPGRPRKQPPAAELVCEICGKTFRQLSYLVSHRAQHARDSAATDDKQEHACAVCNKRYRKLHHLVQHRALHEPSRAPHEPSRGSQAERAEPAHAGAGFRCERCDKSFRKLHHLVEHRETHDTRLRAPTAPAAPASAPATTAEPPRCDVCHKTFRKLHHLSEHKEQHADSGGRARQPPATRDIIHECARCYMVFPNEHSLTKHAGACQRKQRAAATAAAAARPPRAEAAESGAGHGAPPASLAAGETPAEELVSEENSTPRKEIEAPVKKIDVASNKDMDAKENPAEIIKDTVTNVETKPSETRAIPESAENTVAQTTITEKDQAISESSKWNKTDILKTIVIEDTPKKKTPGKSKVAATVTKRQKSVALPAPAPAPAEEHKSSSDEDEVRYMLNPAYLQEQFMRVRANKRSSLQIERPNSKDLVKRRTSLQHPPKLSKLKPKSEKADVLPAQKAVAKAPKDEPVPSSDSDDSDVKYSFPKSAEQGLPIKEEQSSNIAERRSSKVAEQKPHPARKSLTGIAKRKSGKPQTSRSKPAAAKPAASKPAAVKTAAVKPAAAKPATQKPVVKKRCSMPAPAHRCDCGQLFGSAALLARHTSLAHTPPRIRRQRDPPAPASKPPASSKQAASKPPASSKRAHRGVPVPEKMRRMMESLGK